MSGISISGDITVTTYDNHQTEPVEIHRYHNLETDFVMTAIACSLTGEVGQITGSDVTIAPQAMAIGSGTTPVVSSQSGLDSEILRKTFTAPGSSKSRAANKVTFAITLGPTEAVGQIGCLGLFGASTGAPANASGSLTVGGAPGSGDNILCTIAGKNVSPYTVPAADTAAHVATAYAAWLNGDGYFASLYSASASSATIFITSLGQGSMYNNNIAVQTTGAVTCAVATQMSGGATPGGQILAAANSAFTHVQGQTILVEWSVSVTN